MFYSNALLLVEKQGIAIRHKEILNIMHTICFCSFCNKAKRTKTNPIKIIKRIKILKRIKIRT